MEKGNSKPAAAVDNNSIVEPPPRRPTVVDVAVVVGGGGYVCIWWWSWWWRFTLTWNFMDRRLLSDAEHLERNSWILFLFSSLRPLFRFSVVAINRQVVAIIGECSFCLFNACNVSPRHYPPSTYEDHILSIIGSAI